MRRRKFIQGAAVGLTAAASLSMKALNVPSFGVVEKGQIYLATITNPAVGQGGFWTVPSGFGFEIIHVRYVLTCGVTVANRAPAIFATWQNQLIFIATTASVLAALGTGDVNMGRGYGPNLSGSGVLQVCLPQVLLPPETVIEFDAFNFQVTDSIVGATILGIAYPLA